MTASRNSRSLEIINLIITVCIMTLPVYAKYSGGTGEPNDPYQIATAEDLIALGEEPNDYNKCFILIDDIDLAGYIFNKAVIAPDINDIESGFQGTSFTGVFDGSGYKISNLTIIGESYLGIFGNISSEAKVNDLGVLDVNIVSLGFSGLVGYNSSGTVTQCYSTGMVTGNGYVGGLVGYNRSGTLIQCYSTCSVNGTGYNIGGLVGCNSYAGIVSQCYSTGTVTGNSYVGGLVGANYGNCRVIQCYSTGSVSNHTWAVGGLVGENGGDVIQCYSNGSVSGNGRVGGLVGYNYSGSVTKSFWDTQTSGQAYSDGGTGKTTAEMKTFDTFFGAGWYTCGQDAIWTIDEGNDYPRLWWENRAGQPIKPIDLSEFMTGTGTMDDPYLIYTSQELNCIGLGICDRDKHFKLMADIDLSGLSETEFNKIGSENMPFTGDFDGNCHTISHLVVNGDNYLGLFSYFGGEVKNLGLVDVNIVGSGSYVGGLVGGNFGGTVTQCYSTGSVNGQSCVGGIVGYNWGTVTLCYSTCTVSGTSYVGGLVGLNHGLTVSKCYSTGAVSGTLSVGGLVGENDNGTVTQCFWDIQTSGQDTSAGGTGKTTAEMQDPNTFMSAGWDFVGQPDGPSDIWAEPIGGGYPILWWQLSPLPELPTFSGGTGQADDPYLISTTEELNSIGYNPRLMESHFKLIADVNLADVYFYIIGSKGSEYAGVFDGNSYTISNFTYDSNGVDNIGLFGYVTGGTIENLLLIGPNVNAGTGNGVGSLVGLIEQGSIINCESIDGSVSGDSSVGGLMGCNSGDVIQSYSTCTVRGTGAWDVGGLVGGNSGYVTLCYSTGLVIGNAFVGGLVGWNCEGTVNQCFSTGTVRGVEFVGGLLGYNESIVTKSIVTKCYSTGDVIGINIVGGLVGNNCTEVIQCYSTCTVDGNDCVGGLVGSNVGTLIQCYSTGTVNGNDWVGGLVGGNSGDVVQCYSTGTVDGDDNVGGLVGFDCFVSGRDSEREPDITYCGSVDASFWDIQTSGQAYSHGGTGKTTAEMKMMSTFTDAGWDFVGEIINGPNDIWSICEGTNYPRLVWQIQAGDFLCPDGITIEEDLGFFMDHYGYTNCDKGNGYCDGTDLDFSGTVDIFDFKIIFDNWLKENP